MESYGMKIGVTGGIGSGKTTVCRVFSALGIPVFAADAEARSIMESDPEIIKKIISIAGKNIYYEGSLDRSQLADLIFNHSELLEQINSLVHPAVRERFRQWHESQDTSYVILEAAILFETGSYKNVDRIITVVAPFEERIDRVARRNNLTREQILERVRNQSDDEFKVARSDYVIDNSDCKMIIPEILRIHQEIITQVNNRKQNG